MKTFFEELFEEMKKNPKLTVKFSMSGKYAITKGIVYRMGTTGKRVVMGKLATDALQDADKYLKYSLRFLLK